MAPDYVPRAPRLPLRAPIAFRSASGLPWVEGQTVNISRSGVLFALPPASELVGEVEFVINLSRGAMRGPGVALLPDLHCRGRVVRSGSGEEGETLVAARIRRQSIRPPQSFLVTT
jgi:PilZ domain-containing protein